MAFEAAPVLVLEASGRVGSVAVLGPAVAGAVRPVLGERTVPMGASRVDAMTPSVASLLAELALTPDALGGVACGAGPGSFTSLRIAAALAKGLAFGSGLPLFALPSLALATPTTAVGDLVPGSWLITADALRGEQFVQPVDVDDAGRLHVPAQAVRGLPTAIAAEWPARRVVATAADGVAGPRATHARWLADWDRCGPVALDAWEPDYGRLAEAQVQWEARHGAPLPPT